MSNKRSKMWITTFSQREFCPREPTGQGGRSFDQHEYFGPPQEYILVAERRLNAAGHETKCTRANPNQVLQVGGWLRVNSPYRKITFVTETQTDIRNNIQVLGGGGASSKEDQMKPSSESRKEAGQRKSPSSAKCLRISSWNVQTLYEAGKLAQAENKTDTRCNLKQIPWTKFLRA